MGPRNPGRAKLYETSLITKALRFACQCDDTSKTMRRRKYQPANRKLYLSQRNFGNVCDPLSLVHQNGTLCIAPHACIMFLFFYLAHAVVHPCGSSRWLDDISIWQNACAFIWLCSSFTNSVIIQTYCVVCKFLTMFRSDYWHVI